MGLSSGYKRTETGVIPEGWRVLSIMELSTYIIDYRGRTPKKLGMEWGNGDIPALSARNVKKGYIDLEEETYYGSESLYSRWMVNGHTKRDDVVVTTEAPLGNVALVPDNRKYILSQRTVLLHPNPELAASRYLLQALASYPFQKLLSDNATGSTATGIKRKKFEQLKLALPGIVEQQAIAEALGDADTLIESLSQLLAKKRKIKQGAMQKLLSGSSRLPGFSGEWRRKKLGELGESLIGLTYKPSNVKPDGVLVLRASNIFQEALRFEDNVLVDMDVPSAIMLRTGDILICVRNGSRDLIGKCALINEEAQGMTFGAFMAVFRTPFSDFVYHQFQSGVIKRQINEHLGATINQITNKSLNSFQIPFPSDEKERTAIAETLNDMDAEIVALEAKLAKARQLKHAMMQELLTGRTRLV
jgi:type I restriction enzyme, S subunit